MEIKQRVSKPTGYWRNQKGNQNISRHKWQWKHDNSKPMRCSKSSPKREIYNNTIVPQETRKISNRQPNFMPQTTGKRRTKIPQNYQKEKNHKDPSRNKWKRNERNSSKN